MKLSDTAISRPVFTTMVIGALVIFGLVALREIGVDFFPRVEFPVITVVSVLPGADPESVESTVTDPIEEAISNISGIKTLRSTSADGVSQVVVEFELEKDVDVAYQEVQAKLGTVRAELPRDLEEPVVEKFDIDAAPIMAIVLSGEMPIRELTHLADKVVKERLQRVRDVGQVRIVGGRDRQVWLWIDRVALEGHALSVQDVEQALRSEHVEYPGGRIETGPREYAVKTKAEFQSAAQFAEMVVAYRNGAPVRLRDVGWAEDGLEEERSLARLNGSRAVSLLVRRQSGTNTVEVAHAVRAQIETLQRELAPQGVHFEIAQDMSTFIEQSVEEIQFHLVFGGLLAVLIVFLFLRNPRITLISAAAIPTSVVSTFALMNGMGFTMNVITMLALSLSIGLLIDDAIVVIENIFRHGEEGMAPRQAAGYATDEIGLAVLAITLSIVSVFLPVAFMKGMIGRIFYQFGLTVTFAVLVSLFVAFTLTPMLSSRLLEVSRDHGRFFRFTEQALGALTQSYERLLGAALRHRKVTILAALAVFAAALGLTRFLRTEFMPNQDQSEFNIQVKAPLGASLATTDAILQQIRRRLQGRPWLEYTFATIGADQLQRVDQGTIYVKMTDKSQREIGQLEAMRWTRGELADLPQVRVSVEAVPRMGGGGFRAVDLQLGIQGTDLGRLEAVCTAIMGKMRAAEGYTDVDMSYEKGKPELDVYLRRDRAADLGVSSLAVASTVKALVGGDEVSKFRAEGDRYDVSVRLQDSFRNRLEDVQLLTVRNNRGELVRLQNVAWVKEAAGPVQIDRFNRTRQITILANLQRDKKVLGEAIAELNGFVQEAGLPPGYTFRFIGMADVMMESFGYLLFALFLAVVLLYMVLASQFESFVHPFTIMLSLPLAVVGALGILIATGKTMSIFTMIGIIMLMGLVTKNAILLVDFTNTLRHRDQLERDEALLKAGPIRLRPILMTTFAMIFGMLPTALGRGAGAEARSPMAIAVIGGLTTSMLLTLVVVPVVYTLLDDLGQLRWRRLWSWRQRRKAAE